MPFDLTSGWLFVRTAAGRSLNCVAQSDGTLLKHLRIVRELYNL